MQKYQVNENQFVLTSPISCDFTGDGTPYLFAHATSVESPEEKYLLFWELDWENCCMSDDETAFAYDLEKIRKQPPDSIQKI